ncbi:MAG: T9SS type A sorting domain-containing protein, partial [Bacteroidetes bacterium]|nr:T9SS type A sorting domain-containing protein [Bacteroidota bacterium]
LFVGIDEQGETLTMEEFDQKKLRLEKLLDSIDPDVSNVVEEFQWQAVELMQFATAYDFYRAVRGTSRPSVEALLAEFADNAVQCLRGSFVVRNNLSLKLAAAAGYTALMLRGETDYTTQYTPDQWFETAISHIETTLFEYQSSAEGYYGYSEGPWYFRYAMQNLIPFFLVIDEHYGDTGFTLGDAPRISPLRDPRYLRLFEWIATLRMPDGMLPPFEDTYMRTCFPEAAVIAAVQPLAPWLAWMNYDEHGNEIDLARLSSELSRNFDTRVEYLINEAVSVNGSMDLPLTRIWPDAGYAVFRSGWDTEALYFALIGKHGIARTHRSPVGSGHKHANESSFILHAGGELLLLGPGYHSSSKREELIFGENHNILLVDGRGPDSTSWGSFLFGVDAFMQDTLSSADAGMVTIRTAYQGADIERRATFLGDRFVVLADRAVSSIPRTITHQLHGNGLEAESGYHADFAAQKAHWTQNNMTLHAVVASADGEATQETVTRRHAPTGRRFAEHSALYSSLHGRDVRFHTVLTPAPAGSDVRTHILRQHDGISALSVQHAGDDLFSIINTTQREFDIDLPALGVVLSDGLSLHCALSPTGTSTLWVLENASVLRLGNTELITLSEPADIVLAFEGHQLRVTMRADAPRILRLRLPYTIAGIDGHGIADWSLHGGVVRLRTESPTCDFTITMTGILTSMDAETFPPTGVGLHALYPQPATTGNRITADLSLSRAAYVHLHLHDIFGRTVGEGHHSFFPAGSHSVSIPTKGCAPGVYFLSIGTNDRMETHRLLLD